MKYAYNQQLKYKLPFINATSATLLNRIYGIKWQHTNVSKFYSRGTATPYSCGFSDTTFCLSSFNLAPKQPNKIEMTYRFLWGMKYCKKK